MYPDEYLSSIVSSISKDTAVSMTRSHIYTGTVYAISTYINDRWTPIYVGKTESPLIKTRGSKWSRFDTHFSKSHDGGLVLSKDLRGMDA